MSVGRATPRYSLKPRTLNTTSWTSMKNSIRFPTHSASWRSGRRRHTGGSAHDARSTVSRAESQGREDHHSRAVLLALSAPGLVVEVAAAARGHPHDVEGKRAVATPSPYQAGYRTL